MSKTRKIGPGPLYAILAILILLAILRITGPIRAELALQHASLAELQAASIREPDNPRVFYYLGARALEAGNGPLAMRAFLRAATYAPDDQKLWLIWSQTAYAVQGGRAARDILLAFIKVHPQDVLMHLQLAKLLERDGDHRGGYEVAKRAASLDPRSAEACKLMGSAALKLHDTERAESALRRAIALRPQDSFSHAGLGDALFAMTRYSEAVAAYRQAVRLDPEAGTAYMALGQAQLKTASTPPELEAARESLQQALTRPATLQQTGRYFCYLCLGQSYEQQAEWKSALPWLKLAESIEPPAPQTTDDAHFDLARAYLALNDPVGAARENALHRAGVAYFVQAKALSAHLDIHPDDTAASLRLARLFATHHDVEDAYQAYRQTLAHAADKSAIRQEMARAIGHDPGAY